LNGAFKRQNVCVIGANPAGPDHAIAGKLESGYAVVYKDRKGMIDYTGHLKYQ